MPSLVNYETGFSPCPLSIERDGMVGVYEAQLLSGKSKGMMFPIRNCLCKTPGPHSEDAACLVARRRSSPIGGSVGEPYTRVKP